MWIVSLREEIDWKRVRTRWKQSLQKWGEDSKCQEGWMWDERGVCVLSASCCCSLRGSDWQHKLILSWCRWKGCLDVSHRERDLVFQKQEIVPLKRMTKMFRAVVPETVICSVKNIATAIQIDLKICSIFWAVVHCVKGQMIKAMFLLHWACLHTD